MVRAHDTIPDLIFQSVKNEEEAASLIQSYAMINCELLQLLSNKDFRF